MAADEEYINIGSTESMDKKLIKKMLKKAPYPEGMMVCVANGEFWMVLLKNGKPVARIEVDRMQTCVKQFIEDVELAIDADASMN